MDRKIFENNKLVEALCQIIFDPIDDNTIFGVYWDAISPKGVFTQKENASAVNFNLSSPTQGMNPSLTSAMKFMNDNGEKLIQLHNNNIAIHQLRAYDRWESFKQDIDFAYQSLMASMKESFIQRVDLRAINVFELPQDGFYLSRYFNVSLTHPENYGMPLINLTLEIPLETNKFIVVRLHSKINEKAMNVVVDLTYAHIEPKIKTHDLDSLSSILEEGHHHLHDTFVNLITEELAGVIE
ncbi:MAG: TIGR04255 family protein [Cryomorphaceae bacterium]|nr:TIGR04255 family protein [Cryomorphaceae bacterium]